MKLKKAQVLYTKTPPPPLIWIYKCANCLFYIHINDCSKVCRGGEPDKGIINPESFCIIWLNRPDDAPFSWLSK